MGCKKQLALELPDSVHSKDDIQNLKGNGSER